MLDSKDKSTLSVRLQERILRSRLRDFLTSHYGTACLHHLKPNAFATSYFASVASVLHLLLVLHLQSVLRVVAPLRRLRVRLRRLLGRRLLRR